MDSAPDRLWEDAVGDRPLPRFPVEDLRIYLRGTWRLTRQIRDGRAGADGHFEGRVSLTDSSEGLCYREEGELSVFGYRGAAWRCYAFRFRGRYRAEVYFPGGGHFHSLDLRRGTWDVLHRCGEDRYRGTFDACAQDRLRVIWRIRGPRKDLLLDSLLTRSNETRDTRNNLRELRLTEG